MLHSEYFCRHIVVLKSTHQLSTKLQSPTTCYHAVRSDTIKACVKLFLMSFDGIGMPSSRPLNGVQSHMRPTSSVSAATRPGNPGNPAMLSHTLPQMASKAFAGTASRPLNLSLAARGGVTGSVRGPLPQMSRQAYLQQASAQLQNFQGQSQAFKDIVSSSNIFVEAFLNRMKRLTNSEAYYHIHSQDLSPLLQR